MRSFLRSAGAVLALVSLMAFQAAPASAQARDRALDAVRGVTEGLIIKIETGQATERQVWAGVQAVTDALRRFVLAETEIRADEKVAPPTVAGLRPGQAETAPTTEPGETEVSVTQVSNEWFTAQARRAQSSLDGVRESVEQAAPPQRIADGLRGVLAALSDMRYPPG